MRLSALGATALVALIVIGPTAASAQETTTTGEATTTTLPVQKSVHGAQTSNNHCVSHLDPQLADDGVPVIPVSISSDAFGQPHEGKPITLSNTKVTLSIPASILQLGVDAGLVYDGQMIPSVVKVVISGAGTTQKTHTFSISATVTVHVTGGVAQPLSATTALPDTNWTPVSINQQVDFSEKSVLITSTLDLTATIGQVVTATFNCTGTNTAFISLGGLAPPSTTTTAPTTTTTAPPVTGATVAPPVVDPGTLRGRVRTPVCSWPSRSGCSRRVCSPSRRRAGAPTWPGPATRSPDPNEVRRSGAAERPPRSASRCTLSRFPAACRYAPVVVALRAPTC